MTAKKMRASQRKDPLEPVRRPYPEEPDNYDDPAQIKEYRAALTKRFRFLKQKPLRKA